MITHNNKLKTQTINMDIDLDKELEEILSFINQNRLTGNLSKSKIIRLALYEWIEKQKEIKKVIEAHSQKNISKFYEVEQNAI